MELPITLIGFMGCGKSTIGKQIAREKGMNFTDLDDYIQESSGESISNIFKHKGEKEFRNIESQCLREVLLIPDQVVALGGGTPCFLNNMEIIRTLSTSIYLQISPEGLTRRLIRSHNPRPLIRGKSKEELLEFINLELQKREEFYLQADYIIQSDQIQVDELLRLLFF